MLYAWETAVYVHDLLMGSARVDRNNNESDFKNGFEVINPGFEVYFLNEVINI